MKKLIVSIALASVACAPFAAKADEDRINLWPLVANSDFSAGTLFPVWWWNFDKENTFHTLLPAYYYRCRGNETTFWAGCGLMACHSSGKTATHWLAPLYLKSKDMFLSIPYSHVGHESSDTYGFLCGLGGLKRKSDGELLENWFLPFWIKDDHSLFTLPYFYEWDYKGEIMSWCSPLLLSAGWQRHQTWNERYLLGLAGRTKHADSGLVESWCIPFYYGDSRGFLVTPLFGYDRDSNAHWVASLYYTDRDMFVSLPYGSITLGSHTNTWWATPLVGTRSGSKTGGWLFPFFNREKDADFEQSLARLDSPTLPSERPFSSRISGSLLLVSDHDHSVSGRVVGSKDKGSYLLTESVKHGNRLFFNRESSRSVSFDLKTRRRKGETSDTEVMVLCGLFCHEHQADVERNTSHTRTRILWKFWEREENNGNVTVDAFPGFMHDSKTNGYTKTSFLWRFFRYEKEPADGSTKLDLLCLPILR